MYFFLLLLIVSVSSIRGEICDSCLCEGGLVECFLDNCQDVIVQKENIDVLRIHGKLCQNHRNALQDYIYHNTIVVLLDDYCLTIPNCDGLTLSTTTSKPFPFPPIFPKENDLPDPDNEEDDNDDNDNNDDNDSMNIAIITVSVTDSETFGPITEIDYTNEGTVHDSNIILEPTEIAYESSTQKVVGESFPTEGSDRFNE